jgi:hypothetical protein
VILVLRVVLLEPVVLVLEILLVYVEVVEAELSELGQLVFVQAGLKVELACSPVLQFLLQDLPWLIVLICV